MPRIVLSKDTVTDIEDVLNHGYVAEVKIEHGKPKVICIKRKEYKRPSHETVLRDPKG